MYRAASISNLPRARLATAFLFLTVLAANAHVFWTFSLQSSQSSTTGSIVLQCKGDKDYPFMENGSFEYVKLGAYCVIPFVVILTLNLAIIARLRSTTAAAATAAAEAAAAAAAAQLQNRYHVSRFNNDFISAGDSGVVGDEDVEMVKPDVIKGLIPADTLDVSRGHDIRRVRYTNYHTSLSGGGEYRFKGAVTGSGVVRSGSDMRGGGSGGSAGGWKGVRPRPAGVPPRGLGGCGDGGLVWAESRACLRGSKAECAGYGAGEGEAEGAD